MEIGRFPEEGSVVVSGVRRVIVGASGSAGSLPALRYAMWVAQRDHAPLIAVHAWVPPGGELAERQHPSPYLQQVWRNAARERLRDALDAAWAADQDAVDVQPMVVRADPGQALVEMASSADDLLVIGAGRRGRMARMRHGRVSRYCLAHARSPVLAVAPPALSDRAVRRLHGWSFRRRPLTVEQAQHEWEGQKLSR
jgi:nucleotide-binding universal stress UspA family protein